MLEEHAPAPFHGAILLARKCRQILAKNFDPARARGVFFTSLVHLTGLFLALIVDAWLTRPR